MKKQETFATLKTITKLPDPDFQNDQITLAKLAIQSRQKRVNQLRLRGYTNEEIANKIGCGISTVEKDLHNIREVSRSWFEEDAVKDFCQSLQDSIILCDNAIEDLQLLYKEHDKLDPKLKILSTVLEFEKRKTELYQRTKSVQNYLK